MILVGDLRVKSNQIQNYAFRFCTVGPNLWAAVKQNGSRQSLSFSRATVLLKQMMQSSTMGSMARLYLQALYHQQRFSPSSVIVFGGVFKISGKLRQNLWMHLFLVRCFRYCSKKRFSPQIESKRKCFFKPIFFKRKIGLDIQNIRFAPA